MLYKFFCGDEIRQKVARLLASDRIQDREEAAREAFNGGFISGLLLGIIGAAIWVANSPAADL